MQYVESSDGERKDRTHMALKKVTDIVGRLFFSDPLLIAPELADFDPIFYRAHYGDLHHLNSAAALRRHFVKHGRREGRWRNLAEATNHFTSRFGPLPGDFRASTYRALNEDLARVFDHEWEFGFHYLESGQKEGRRYKREDSSPADPARSWMTLFRLADFVACAQSWLDEIPQTKERGIAIFLDSGIDRLAPINLNFIFDPNFYRSAYGFDDRMNDATLYRR
jgi:hypothetical protein